MGGDEEHPAVTQPKVGDLDLSRMPTEFGRLVAPVKLIGLAEGKDRRNEHLPRVMLLLALPVPHIGLQRHMRTRIAFILQLLK